MHITAVILADESFVKVIVFVIMAIIWGIGGLSSMVKKANEEAKRRAARGVPSGMVGSPPTMPTAMSMSATSSMPTMSSMGVTASLPPARRPPPMPPMTAPMARRVEGFDPSVVQRAQAMAASAGRVSTGPRSAAEVDAPAGRAHAVAAGSACRAKGRPGRAGRWHAGGCGFNRSNSPAHRRDRFDASKMDAAGNDAAAVHFD